MSTNQLRRQDEENKGLREKLEEALSQEKEARSKLKEQQNKYIDLESKVYKLEVYLGHYCAGFMTEIVFSQMKDDLMMSRIKEAEHTQCVAELKQRISRLELKVSHITLYSFYY